MLKFLKIFKKFPEKIEINDYLPLVIKWGDSSEIEPEDYLTVDPKLYWSLASKSTLLEIGMDEASQSVRIVKLVLTGKYHKSGNKINADIISQIGVPVFDTKIWDKSHYFTDFYFREEGEFDLYVGSNQISIFLSKNEIKYQINSGRVHFGFDKENCLCIIEVDDFSTEEMEKLIDTLEYQKVSSESKG